ncbi:unnamed protein product [Gordionus sp. m RMFG-2023]
MKMLKKEPNEEKNVKFKDSRYYSNNLNKDIPVEAKEIHYINRAVKNVKHSSKERKRSSMIPNKRLTLLKQQLMENKDNSSSNSALSKQNLIKNNDDLVFNRVKKLQSKWEAMKNADKLLPTPANYKSNKFSSRSSLIPTNNALAKNEVKSLLKKFEDIKGAVTLTNNRSNLNPFQNKSFSEFDAKKSREQLTSSKQKDSQNFPSHSNSDSKYIYANTHGKSIIHSISKYKIRPIPKLIPTSSYEFIKNSFDFAEDIYTKPINSKIMDEEKICTCK